VTPRSLQEKAKGTAEKKGRLLFFSARGRKKEGSGDFMKEERIGFTEESVAFLNTRGKKAEVLHRKKGKGASKREKEKKKHRMF